MPQTLSDRFSQLSLLLQDTQLYWREIAFYRRELSWMSRHPDLVSRLQGLSLPQIDALATQAADLYRFVEQDLLFVEQLKLLSTLPALPQRVLPEAPPRFHAGIPGRKWQQVTAFSACLPHNDLPVLEWCAGKSHLGFYLHYCDGQAVTALEWDTNLVQQANLRAQGSNIALQSYPVNVLQAQATNYIQPMQHAVALHACGDLHERLLMLCGEQRIEQVSVAPCCYQKRHGDVYVPLSQQGKATGLKLNKHELHTAVMETVTAGATLRQQRVHLQTMRLGFDCLQREVRGIDEFLPVPSLPARWGREEFSAFCGHCAEMKNIPLPEAIDWAHYWQAGQQRFLQVSALDLIRFVFRRALEVWLVLDRALLLQEQGYQVSVGAFCSAQITPRNLLITASLR